MSALKVLTDAEREEIIRCFISGTTVLNLAFYYEVDEQRIFDILREELKTVRHKIWTVEHFVSNLERQIASRNGRNPMDSLLQTFCDAIRKFINP